MSELKILEEKENALFNRKEIKGSIESEIVPSRAETIEILSKKFKVPLENIKIKKIIGKFGSKTFSIEANIYSSEQDKDSIELKKKKEKAPEELAEEKTVEEKPEKPKEQPEQKQEQPKEQPEQTEPTEQPKPEAAQEPIEEPAQPETPKDSDKPENQSEPQGEANKQ